MTEKYIDGDSFTRYQLLVIGLCALINILDGFDVMAIAYTAPQIASEWDLSPEKLGLVFSAGYLGMALGAMLLAPCSDRLGRRKTIIASMVVIIISMLLTASAGSVNALLAYRFSTGLAIGAMLASITALAAEYSPEAKKNFAVSIVQGSYAIGATVGGFVTALLISEHGWRFIFFAGAMINLLFFLVIVLLLPESLAFLVNKRPPGGLARANRIIARLGGSLLPEWPPLADAVAGARTGLRGLLQGDMKQWTLLLWLTAFSAMFGVYFLMSWIPKIIVDAGFPLERAIWVGVCITGGGLAGILWLGYQSASRGLRPMIAAFLFTAGLLMMVFGSLDAGIVILMLTAVALGFFSQGGLIGLYSVAARLYSTNLRATGIGWTIGIGRLGAIAGPVIGGVFIGLQWQQSTYFIVLSLPFLCGALSIFYLRAPQLLPRVETRPVAASMKSPTARV